LITATIEGDEYHAYATEAYSSSRYYYLTIRAPVGKEYSDGTKVTFKISGYSADQTATYKAGSSTKLDLTASSDAVAAPVNAWLTTLLALLLSAAFGIACYFLIRMMVRRRRLARPVTAVQAHKVEAQPLSRYVWDNAKLAWVENTKLVMKSVKANVPVAAGAGVARQKGQDKSVTVDAQNGVVTQKQAAPIPGKEAASK
jgi:hypothetical protein